MLGPRNLGGQLPQRAKVAPCLQLQSLQFGPQGGCNRLGCSPPSKCGSTRLSVQLGETFRLLCLGLSGLCSHTKQSDSRVAHRSFLAKPDRS
jgi:hypothetical protein